MQADIRRRNNGYLRYGLDNKVLLLLKKGRNRYSGKAEKIISWWFMQNQKSESEVCKGNWRKNQEILGLSPNGKAQDFERSDYISKGNLNLTDGIVWFCINRRIWWVYLL